MPTAAELSGDFSGVDPRTQLPFGPVYDPETGLQFPGNVIPRDPDRIDPMALKFNQVAFAAPNCTACLAAGLGFNYVGNGAGYSKMVRYHGRLDHRIGDRDNLFFNFQFNPSKSIALASPIPAEPVASDTPSGFYALSWNHVFNPRLLNEARAGYVRNKGVVGQVADAQGAFPFHNTPFYSPEIYPMIILTGYPAPFGNQLMSQKIMTEEEHWDFSDNLTWMHGNHQIKVGAEVIRDHFYGSSNFGGFFIYGDQLPAALGYTMNTVADYLLGVPLLAVGLQGTGKATMVERSRPGLYFQDDWKISSRLTLNLGLRWDYQQRWHDSNTTLNRLGTLDLSPASYAMGGRFLLAGSPDYYVPGTGVVKGSGPPLVRSQIVDPAPKDFQPRIGLAYRPFNNNKTAIRAGYGIYFVVPDANSLAFEMVTPPFQYFTTIVNIPATTKMEDFFPSIGPLGSGTEANGIHNRDPRVQQWTLSIQHQIANNFLLSAEYLGNHGTRNTFTMNINEPALPNAQQLAELKANPANNLTMALARLPLPNVGYQFQYVTDASDSWYHALNLKAEGRFRQRLHFSASYTWAKALDQVSAEQLFPVTVYNHRLDKSYADFDHRHRFVASWVYNLPLGEQFLVPHNAALKKLVAGWEFTGISTFESGPPFSVGMGVDTSFRGGIGTVYPNLTGPPVYSDIRASNGIFLTPTNYTHPPWGQLGGTPRNYLHGPGLNNFDLGFIKNTAIKERVRVQFRAEMFNAFNHAQFYTGNQALAYSIAAPAQGQTEPQVQYYSPSQFGRVSARSSRIVQFGLKLLF
jgi:hypothetical protein